MVFCKSAVNRFGATLPLTFGCFSHRRQADCTVIKVAFKGFRDIAHASCKNTPFAFTVNDVFNIKFVSRVWHVQSCYILEQNI